MTAHTLTERSIDRVRQAFERARGSTFVRDVAVLSGSTALGQAVVLLATPALTRLYAPEAFGVYGVFLSAISVASVVVTLRFDVAIPGARDDDEALALLVLALLVALPLAVAMSALLWVLARMHIGGLGVLRTHAIVLTLPGLLGFGVTSSLRYWLIRGRAFRSAGQVSLAQGAARAVVPVVLGPFALGWTGIAAGEVVGRWLGIGTMLRAAWPHRVRAFAPGWGRRVRAAAWRYRVFSATMLPSTLADALAVALPVPLIGATYGAHSAGIFLLVQRLVALPASLVGMSVADVFHAEVAQLFHTSPDDVPRAVFRTSGYLAKIGLLTLGPVALLAPFLAEFVFGHAWRQVGISLGIIAPWALANLIVMPVSRVLIVVRRNELKLVYDVLTLSLLTGSVWLAHRQGYTFASSLVLMSASQCVSYAVYFGLIAHAARKPARAQR